MKWLTEEIDFIIKNYPINGTEYCSRYLNKPIKTVSLKVGRLGLKLNKNIYYILH